MSSELQERAKRFIARPIPKSMKYVPGSMAEQIIAAYAKNGRVEADAELLEMLELCVMDSENVALETKGEEKAYLTESGEILRAIILQASGA